VQAEAARHEFDDVEFFWQCDAARWHMWLRLQHEEFIAEPEKDAFKRSLATLGVRCPVGTDGKVETFADGSGRYVYRGYAHVYASAQTLVEELDELAKGKPAAGKGCTVSRYHHDDAFNGRILKVNPDGSIWVALGDWQRVEPGGLVTDLNGDQWQPERGGVFNCWFLSVLIDPDEPLMVWDE
jgi:hypothetical protein